VYYATIPDVAVDPALQGGGIDRRMMTKLLRRLHVQKVYLTAVLRREGFHEKLGFLQ